MIACSGFDEKPAWEITPKAPVAWKARRVVGERQVKGRPLFIFLRNEAVPGWQHLGEKNLGEKSSRRPPSYAARRYPVPHTSYEVLRMPRELSQTAERGGGLVARHPPFPGRSRGDPLRQMLDPCS